MSVQNGVTPNWTGANTQGKTCLSFCPYVNCNNGTCYQDPKNCGLSCICEVGYWGRRCQFEIRTTTLSPIHPDPKSSSDSDIVRMSLSGSVKDNVEDKGNTSSLNTSKVSAEGEENLESIADTRETSTENPTESLTRSFNSFLPASNRNILDEPPSRNKQSNGGTIPVASVEKEDRITIKMNKSKTKTESTSTSHTTTTQTDVPMGKEEILSETMLTTTTKSLAMVTTIATDHEDSHDDENESLLLSTSKSELALGVLDPFKSKYLDECEKNCANDSVCVPIQNNFHCYPKKYNCLKGFPCENGICVKNENEKKSQFNCLCEPGWIGDMCNHKCYLNCNGGTCYRGPGDSYGEIVCLCTFGYEGKRCEHQVEIIPEEENSWHWYVLIPVICCFVIVVVVLTTILYCMQKRKWLFAMKIVHFFKDYEDDDGKEYDAFISYKSSKEDEDFVLHQLYQKLEEEMGFKLCMHFRDFTPGDIIANNIIHAIENSRRTIMVLSPNYVESEWCRMEYQKAQHEMLKRKHRIIPIMFRDISKADKCDSALYDILHTVTYIQWPEDGDSLKIDRFWNQLRLSLPKKRMQYSPSSPHHPSSESLSTDTSDIYSSSSFILPPIPSTPISSSVIDESSISKSDNIFNITGKESSILNNSYPSYVTTEKPDSDLNHPQLDDSSLSAVQVQALSAKQSQPDNSSSRLRKIVKDMLKLKIHSRSNSFMRLQREGSIETPTPTTSSPNVLLDKEVNPLIAKRKNKKSSTWTAKSLQHTLRPCARSMSEKDCSVNRLDILPQSSVRRRELPDVCQHLDQGHDNAGFENDIATDKRKDVTEKDHSNATSMDSSRNTVISNELERNIQKSMNDSEESKQFKCDSNVPSVDVGRTCGSDSTNVCMTCIQNTETSNLSVDDSKSEQSKQAFRSFRNDRVRKSKKSNVPRRHSDGVKINIQSTILNDNQVPVNIMESSIFNCDYPSYQTSGEVYGNSSSGLYNFGSDRNLQNSSISDLSNVFNDWINEPYLETHSESGQSFVPNTKVVDLDELNHNSSCSPNSVNANSENIVSKRNFPDNPHCAMANTTLSSDSECQIRTQYCCNMSNNSCMQYNVLPDESCHRNCETCIIANDSDTNSNNNPCLSIYIPPSYILPAVQTETSKIQNTATDCLIPRGPSGGACSTDVQRRSSVPNSPKIVKPLKRRMPPLPRRVSAPHLLNAVPEIKDKDSCTEEGNLPTPVPPVRRKRRQRNNVTKPSQ